MSKLTPWFHGEVKPARKGVYQRNFGRRHFYAYWSGSKWHMSCRTPAIADCQHWISGTQNLPWRGLASDPSKEST